MSVKQHLLYYIYGCFMFQCWMLFLDLEVMDIEFLKFHVYIASFNENSENVC